MSVNNSGPGMSARDLRRWAKEEILDAIDKRIKAKSNFAEDADPYDADEREAMRRERDRVAFFMGLGVASVAARAT